MRLVGVLLLSLGVAIVWLLGLRGLTVAQAIADVQQSLHLNVTRQVSQPLAQTSTPNVGAA